MASAVHVRYQVEDALARRHPAALRPITKVVRPIYGTGVAEVDALLEGGLPVGAISELTGPACSGRVSLAMSFVARQTRDGQVCAWVDCADGFDPESAASSGVEMNRLLWVRCGGELEPPPAETRIPHTAGSEYAVTRTRETGTICGGMHPRTEAHGMASALGDWLLGTPVRESVRMSGKPGTPGALNRVMATGEQNATGAGQVQVPTDRVPARRGEHALEQKSRLAAGETGAIIAEQGALAAQAQEYARVAPRCAETQQGLHKARQVAVSVMPHSAMQRDVTPSAQPMAKQDEKKSRKAARVRSASPWDRMDRVVQTTDLLLQGSGFSCIVMDLSGVDARYAHRIPLATWFRFRAAADRTRTSLLVLTRHPCTGSSGEVMLRLRAGAPGGTTVMTGVPVAVELVRQRFTGQRGFRGLDKIVSIRKPPTPVTEAEWCAPTTSSKAAGVAG